MVFIYVIIVSFDETTRVLNCAPCSDFSKSYSVKKNCYQEDSGLIHIYVPYSAKFYASKRDQDNSNNCIIYDCIGQKCVMKVVSSKNRINLSYATILPI